MSSKKRNPNIFSNESYIKTNKMKAIYTLEKNIFKVLTILFSLLVYSNSIFNMFIFIISTYKEEQKKYNLYIYLVLSNVKNLFFL